MENSKYSFGLWDGSDRVAINKQTLDSRIASRHAFETRIRITLQRNGRKFSVQGWTRDLSESGLSAFVAETLGIGEPVLIELSLPDREIQLLPARVARNRGTEYGFEFTALSSAQRLLIRHTLRGRSVIAGSGKPPHQ